MSVYTKTGDRGKTSLFSGKRVLKSSKIISAIGSVDELNSYLGIIGGLINIQKNLFAINAILAGSNPAVFKNFKDPTQELEAEIDKMEKKLPVQTNFLIYGGCKTSKQLYYARSICRKAERKLVSIKNVDKEILKYINRLSDYLFILARYINFQKKVKEKTWSV